MQGPCRRLQSKDLGYEFDGPVTMARTHARTELYVSYISYITPLSKQCFKILKTDPICQPKTQVPQRVWAAK